MTRLILTGDVNLMGVEDATVPFARVKADFKAADLVFSNLECCLYAPAGSHSVDHEGFFANPTVAGAALTGAGIAVVGVANNVNYGEAAIEASIAALDRHGIAHTGAGANRTAARIPAIVTRNGVRFGFLQRSSVYWPTNHEAADNATGIAVIRAHTAYQVPMHKIRPEIPPMNRPGLPPVILTWADPVYLRWLREDIAALRQQADIVVVSCHWGLGREVLAYMTEIAHAAIDAGADVVIGHGPHHFLPVELYRGKPIFYGLGSFSFHTGHGGRKHGDWIGLMADVEWEGPDLSRASFQFVRHNDKNETTVATPADEPQAVAEISEASATLGVRISVTGNRLSIDLTDGRTG
ncbi:CapA family protein [Acidisphaera sp. S103]|uniref:CapA family protein n=1 Tax=Acidisphaera sp. S103 TaxID=1747223 RepID=UPI00131E3369|nr:CapA family protein [Acidisphaera sp. S103]